MQFIYQGSLTTSSELKLYPVLIIAAGLYQNQVDVFIYRLIVDTNVKACIVNHIVHDYKCVISGV